MKIRNRRRFCKSETNKKLFDVITEVKLDPISSKKILNISSPYCFINNCDKIIKVTLFDEKKVAKQVICESNHK